MKRVLQILAVMLVLTGIVWILQDVNVLPGSFMTGQIQWAYYGAGSTALGLLLWWLASRG